MVYCSSVVVDGASEEGWASGDEVDDDGGQNNCK